MTRAVFLDRDGVLNATFVRAGISHPPQTIAEVTILPGVPAALLALKQLGVLLIVVTNQPDVARGSQTAAAVLAINHHLATQLPLDEFRVCMHDTADHCDCRKPQPGLLLAAAKEHNIDLTQSFMVGDRSTDILAGFAAGCKTFLVDNPYNTKDQCTPDYTVRDLAQAAELIGQLAQKPI